MAVPFSLSNGFSLHTPSRLCLRASLLSKPSKTLELKTLDPQSHLLSHSLGWLSLSSPYPIRITINNRPSFRASLAFEDSTIPTNDDDDALNEVNTSKSESHQKHTSSLKSLIEVYKEAILDGDEKTISDIETEICVAENEKNHLVQKVSDLSDEINSGKEKYICLQADFDNFRKRSGKERLAIRSDAEGEVIESLLPMVDNFERAKQQIKLETEKEKKIDASYQGIYKQFVEIMRSLRVATVATVGNPFDPALHEAIAREESQEFKEGIIIEEFRRGFLLGDRLIRPAMVKVSAGPGKRKPLATVEQSTEQTATAVAVDEQ